MLQNLPSALSELVPLIPIGGVVSFGLFFAGRRYLMGDKRSEIVTKELTTFVDEQKKCFAMIRCHQAGKPCNAHKTLKPSRVEISVKLKELTTLRDRICIQLPEQFTGQWKIKHLEWKEAMQGDVGIITERAAVCPFLIMQLDPAQTTYQDYLVALRQNVTSGGIKVIKLSLKN